MAGESFCRSAVARTLEKWGKINYLVNNAFSFTAKGLDATRADWERIFFVGPVAYAVMAQLVLEPMKAAERRRDREYVQHLGLHRAAEPVDLQRREGRCPQPDQVHGVRSCALQHPRE